MAYVDALTLQKRLAAAAGATAIQAGIAAALIAGLSITYVVPEPEGVVITHDVFVPPPPPDDIATLPADTPVIETSYTPPVAPETQVELFETSTTTTSPVILAPLPISTIGIGLPLDPPTPLFTAHGPVPTNGPIGWVTNADYPRRALQRGWEGEASYALTVDENGQVDNCTITASTGHSVLDDASCRWVERRARFDPAMNSAGSLISGTYRGQIAWQIPED